MAEVSANYVTPSVSSGSTISPSTSAGQTRYVSIELCDMDIANQCQISELINDPKIMALRAQFSSLLIVSATVEVSTLCLWNQMGVKRPVRFGFTGSRNAGIAAANAIELPKLKMLPFSMVNQVIVEHNEYPPGLNMDLGAVALHAGHPIAIITSDGQITAQQGASLDIAGGFVHLTLSCSGVGNGTEYQI